MDFLDSIYFDNSVRSYLVVAGIILFVLIVKKVFVTICCITYI